VVLLTPLPAQTNAVLTVIPPEKISGKRNEMVTADFRLELRHGYHVNSNTPNDDYLIPLKFTWADGPAQAAEVIFPKPQLEKYEFSAKPVSVFTGEFKTQTRFKILPTAPLGPAVLAGKIRYQACTERACLPPRTIDVKVPIFIHD
jgi:thiol:disulfide interchange protein DsbD